MELKRFAGTPQGFSIGSDPEEVAESGDLRWTLASGRPRQAGVDWENLLGYRAERETGGVVMKQPVGGAQPLPRIERIKIRIEHEVDTRSVGVGAWLLRRTKGRVVRLWHRQALVLTTRGRKSGLDRTVPLQFFPDGESMIVVAANSGLPSPPGWYFNLTADPRARVEVAGRTLRVRAEELAVDEAAAFWPRVLDTAPDYAKYPKRTSRRIPLIRLVPVAQVANNGASESHVV